MRKQTNQRFLNLPTASWLIIRLYCLTKVMNPQFNIFGEIIGMPTTYIYDKEGVLIDYHLGEIDIEYLEKTIL